MCTDVRSTAVSMNSSVPGILYPQRSVHFIAPFFQFAHFLFRACLFEPAYITAAEAQQYVLPGTRININSPLFHSSDTRLHDACCHPNAEPSAVS